MKLEIMNNETWTVYAILLEKKFYQKIYEKCGLEINSKPFLMFKDSSVKENMKRYS